MLDEAIAKELGQEDLTDFHRHMLTTTLSMLSLSRSTMSQYYAIWDANDDNYRNRREVDEKDKNAAKRGEPIKMVVPVGYSQVQSFVAFGMGLYTQRDHFFELMGVGPEDEKAAKTAEAFLDRDLRHNIWEGKLYQFLLDVARFGVGIIKTCWTRDVENRLIKRQMGGVPYGVMAPVTTYVGNKILSVSPYQWFPDPRLPISRMQEGEFVGMEQAYSRHTLTQLEKNGEIVGLKYVPKCSKQMVDQRGTNRVFGLSYNNTGQLAAGVEDNTVIISEVQRTLIPNEFEFDGKKLGPEDYPIKYDLWIANDSRIIRCRKSGYVHGQYTYDVGEYNPDVINFANNGLLDSISVLQDALSWFINSRITNVRKIIGDRLIVDPTGVEVGDLKERNPIVRLKPSASGRGVEKFIKQLDLVDVTTNHIQDADVLYQFIQRTTAINDTLMGEVASGRRSATENRNVTNAATGRLKMIFSMLFRGTLEPMGRKMLSNLQDGLDEQQVVRLVGLQTAMEGAGLFIKANKMDLIGDYDFEVFDGTLPSERHLNAQALEQILLAFMSNPQAALALQIDPHAVLKRWLELRGFRHPELFFLPYPPQTPQNGTNPNPGAPGAPPTGGAPTGGTPPGISGAPSESLLPDFGGQGQY